MPNVNRPRDSTGLSAAIESKLRTSADACLTAPASSRGYAMCGRSNGSASCSWRVPNNGPSAQQLMRKYRLAWAM